MTLFMIAILFSDFIGLSGALLPQYWSLDGISLKIESLML